MENNIPSSKINIVKQNLNRKCILNLLIDLFPKSENFEEILIFPNFVILRDKMTISEILGRNFLSGIVILNSRSMGLQITTT